MTWSDTYGMDAWGNPAAEEGFLNDKGVPSSVDLVVFSLEKQEKELKARALEMRGVPDEELQQRFVRAQALMAQNEVDFLLVTTQEDFFYFTGILSRFWNSPTRPYYLLIPAQGRRPRAVVPNIMTEILVSRSWLEDTDVKGWASPCIEDDGITLLVESMEGLELTHRRAGLMLGHESTIRMPVRDIDRLRGLLAQRDVVCVDGSRITRELRLVKSPFEVARIRHACDIASAAFEALPSHIDMVCKRKAERNDGLVTEREVRDAMRYLLLHFGADDMPYVMTQSGNNGYDNIILEPGDGPLFPGDVVVIDTGICFEGYWCDFDRNFVVGGEQNLSDATSHTHDLLWLATEAGFEACKRHETSSAVFRAMAEVLGIQENSVGRMGHGLGLHITEHFSNNATDEEPLRPGMTMTLEPGMLVDPNDPSRMLVHEENVLITQDGAEWLSTRASRRMASILASRDAFAALEVIGVRSKL